MIVGEYYTAPYPGGDPSRTTVVRYGNVWVGNRGIGENFEDSSVTCIGLVIGGTGEQKTPRPAHSPLTRRGQRPPGSGLPRHSTTILASTGIGIT